MQAMFIKELQSKKGQLSNGTLSSIKNIAKDLVAKLDAEFNATLSQKFLNMLTANAGKVNAKIKPKDFKDAYNQVANQAKLYFTLNKPMLVKLIKMSNVKGKENLAEHFSELSIYVYFMTMLVPTITDAKANVSVANFQKVVDRFSSYYSKYTAPLMKAQPQQKAPEPAQAAKAAPQATPPAGK
jgi:hypothetical protein